MNDIYVDETTLTGQCAVTVVKVDRTCIAILDACERYPLSHLESKLDEERLSDTICFYSTAFFIDSNFEALMAMANFANNHNRIFGFNFAAEYIYQEAKDKLLEVMKLSDFIFCNKAEAIVCGHQLKAELMLKDEDLKLENE